MNVKRRPKALILRTAGTNCDVETGYAFDQAGAASDRVHINRLIENGAMLKKYSILAIPGGFSYGDDIASGKILANEIRYKLRREMNAFIRAGKIIIGICNGFQVLVKSGLLPNTSGKGGGVEASLSLNDTARYEDRWVYLKPAAVNGRESRCVWTKGMDSVIYLPVAHAEGKFISKNSNVLNAIEEKGQVVLRYCRADGSAARGFPDNPNGSIEDIAGICDPTGRVFGLMPHPERYITKTQHPFWTRMPAVARGDGFRIFRNGVEFASSVC